MALSAWIAKNSTSSDSAGGRSADVSLVCFAGGESVDMLDCVGSGLSFSGGTKGSLKLYQQQQEQVQQALTIGSRSEMLS